MMNAIQQAIEIIGSQTKLAALLGVSKAAVNQWKLPGRKVPVIHCSVIERETKGAVRCEDLRPDINWSFMRHDERKKENGAVPHTIHTRSTNGDAIGTPLKRRAEDKIDEKESA
jgi:DNA-binding transcriptional regulator YdaS (Cro superfamily)